MWKPAEVVPEHKCRATVFFSCLVIAIFAYAGNLVYQAVKVYKHPNTSFTLSNDPYRYPGIYVCTYDFYGCDDESLLENCTRSAHHTEGGASTAVFNTPKDDRQELKVGVINTGQRGWCVSFDTSEISFAEDGRDPERYLEDYIVLNMYWYPGGFPNNSDTCIYEEGEWESHSESVFIHFRDIESDIPSAGIQVRYSCMTSASNSHIFNYVRIGLTKENHINSANTASYHAVATSSAIYKDKRDANITGIVSPYAWLSMEIAREANSLEVIAEIDPLKIAEMFGNVGGFWDLLLLLWPVFFVTTRQRPHLRVRNFKKSAMIASKNVVRVSETLSRPLALKRHTTLARRAEQRTTGESIVGLPSWERDDAAFQKQNSSHKHGPQHLGVQKIAALRRSPALPPISRAPAIHSLMTPDVSRTSAQGLADGNGQQLARAPPRQGGLTPPSPLTATSLGSGQAFTV